VNALFERLFNDPFFTDVPVLRAVDQDILPLDVSEDATHVIVRASLPGYSKDSIDVAVQDGVLAISASQEQADEQKTEQYHRKERRFGSVSRRIALPSPVVEKDAQAELRDGVLTLRLTKVQPEQPHRIQIT
jgi:HSP20 family protein